MSRLAAIVVLMVVLLSACRVGVPESTPTLPPAPAATATYIPTQASASATPMPPQATAVPATATPTRAGHTPTPVPASPTAPQPLPTPTTAIAPGTEILVDNGDRGFSTAGTWFVSAEAQSYGDDSAWAPRGIQNIAYVRPELPAAGSYEVFAWWCGDPNHDHALRAHIQVYPTTGFVATHPVYVNLQENTGRWNSLGTYYLEQDGSLSVDGTLDGNIVADAFRFVYRSAERITVVPTPLPTTVPWTGHPPSPLEQLTSGDLSARLGLVQRFYPYTPIVSSVEATFDDCEAFLRPGCNGSRDGWTVTVQYQEQLATYRVSEDYHWVQAELSPALVNQQTLYLHAVKGNYFLRVDRYPDDTWHLSGAIFDQTDASHWPLDETTVEKLKSLVQTYSSLEAQTADGLGLRLYGLGPQVGLSEEDSSELAALASHFAATVWSP